MIDTGDIERLPNTEPKLRELFAKLQAEHGTVLVVLDQSASIGAGTALWSNTSNRRRARVRVDTALTRSKASRARIT